MKELVEIAANPADPASLLKAREAQAQRLMLVYALTGLFFMLLPGTFLGVWNLISISEHHGAAIPAAWIQAHGHAQIFGWIGTFIMGIGFYSIPKMTGGRHSSAMRGWITWLLWTAGVLLRWATGVYEWHWRAALPVSAALELAAFVIFLDSVRRHPSPASKSSGGAPVWIQAVLVGSAGFGVGLLMNLMAALYVSVRGTGPAFPAGFESRFLALLAFLFIAPTIWGFSARWLPVFLGLKPVNSMLLRTALVLATGGVLLQAAGFSHASPWLFALAALAAISALHLLRRAERPAKTTGVHSSFPIFVRTAYIWLLIATGLGT
ncbi:MAG TPA: hypothetical protein VLT16_16680, partial [Candidatus Limnocylindrales bacterium]|nr:hypothetical protein [Candidatus Limnocylindrales bacterium]